MLSPLSLGTAKATPSSLSRNFFDHGFISQCPLAVFHRSIVIFSSASEQGQLVSLLSTDVALLTDTHSIPRRYPAGAMTKPLDHLRMPSKPFIPPITLQTEESSHHRAGKSRPSKGLPSAAFDHHPRKAPRARASYLAAKFDASAKDDLNTKVVGTGPGQTTEQGARSSFQRQPGIGEVELERELECRQTGGTTGLEQKNRGAQPVDTTVPDNMRAKFQSHEENANGDSSPPPDSALLRTSRALLR